MDEEVIQKIIEFKSLMDRGKRVASSDVTNIYNIVFSPKKVSNTNCSTCIKRRISELYKYYIKYGREKAKVETHHA